jgi:hypothetical protein
MRRIREVCAWNAVLRFVGQPGREVGVRFLLPTVPHPSNPDTASHP